MISRLLRRFRRDRLRAEVEASLKRGTGLRKEEWLLHTPMPSGSLERTAGEVIDWCQTKIGETRRPYGVDQMALAIACAEPGGDPIASKTFGVFRPVDFYRDGGISERVEEFFQEFHETELNERQAIRFAAVLFSWGDVARDTIFKESGGNEARG